MKRGRLMMQLIVLFGGVGLAYALIFAWVESRRISKGPWEVTITGEAGQASLVINQPTLNIRDLRLKFLEVTAPSNTVQRVRFIKAQNPPFSVPFGQCVFQDILFLPGTVTLQILGHEIQCMPRVLTIDKVEYPWRSGETIEIRPLSTNALPVAP